MNPDLLHGVIDVTEASGRFVTAWYSGEGGTEHTTSDPRVIRQQLTSARDLHRAAAAAALGKRRGRR